ncbi:MAG: histidine kinase dimerization/phospho-acceptor domain-containing protein, partial [Pseudomonadota bacterium]
MPRRLYPRSLLLVVAPVLLLLAAMTFVFYDLHWRQTSRKMSQSVAGEIAYILEARTLNTAISEKAIFDQALRTMRIQSEFRPGESLPPNPKRSLFTALDDTLSQELSVSLSQPFWYDISGYDKRVEIRVAVEGGVMAFGVDRDRTFSTTGHMFLFWALGASIVLIALSLAFLRNHVRSVLDLAAAAKAFGRGRDVPGFRPYGATEVREAARAVIDMRGRLNAAAEQRTAVLAGVSHDLRTPITRLKLQLAMAEDSKDVDDMRRDLDEMSALLDEYLSFARGEEAETTQTIELDALVRNIADAQSGSKIVVMTSPRVEIEGRPLA